MTEHTKTDGLPGIDAAVQPQVLERSRPRNERMAGDKIECNACPVLCQISPGRAGACDRYANHAGTLGSLGRSKAASMISAEATISLSASGSSILPRSETLRLRRAK